MVDEDHHTYALAGGSMRCVHRRCELNAPVIRCVAVHARDDWRAPLRSLPP